MVPSLICAHKTDVLNEKNRNMISIKVNPFLVNANGERDHFGEETGTPEFYIILKVLHKYLGEENISISWDYTEFFYKIEVMDDKEIDYIQIIESINEPFSQFNKDYHKNDHLIFTTTKV